MAFPVDPKPTEISETPMFRTDVVEAENGSEARAQRWPSNKRILSLFYDLQTSTTIYDHYKSVNGRAGAFTINPNDLDNTLADETLTVRYMADDYGRTLIKPGYHSFEIVLIEVK